MKDPDAAISPEILATIYTQLRAAAQLQMNASCDITTLAQPFRSNSDH